MYCIAIVFLLKSLLYYTISEVADIQIVICLAMFSASTIFFPGAHPPDLTPEQLEMSSSRLCAVLGKALGVVVGCLIGERNNYIEEGNYKIISFFSILGMFPLLFIDSAREEDSPKPLEK